MKWDKSASRRSRGNSDFEESHHFMSVHDMFRYVQVMTSLASTLHCK